MVSFREVRLYLHYHGSNSLTTLFHLLNILPTCVLGNCVSNHFCSDASFGAYMQKLSLDFDPEVCS